MSTDPQIRIRELVARCRAKGSVAVYIDQPFFDAVCRAYAVDPRKAGLRRLALDGFEIGRLDILPPPTERERKAAAADFNSLRQAQEAAAQAAAMFGTGFFRFT